MYKIGLVSEFFLKVELIFAVCLNGNQFCVAIIPHSKTFNVLAFAFDVLQCFLQINQATVHFLFTAVWDRPMQGGRILDVKTRCLENQVTLKSDIFVLAKKNRFF